MGGESGSERCKIRVLDAFPEAPDAPWLSVIEALELAMKTAGLPTGPEGVSDALANLRSKLEDRDPKLAMELREDEADLRVVLRILHGEALGILMRLDPKARRVFVERRLNPEPTPREELAERLGITVDAVARLEVLVAKRLHHGAGLGATQTLRSAAPVLPRTHDTVAADGSYVVCLECGAHRKMLRSHLRMAHGMSVEQYLERWNLETDHPLTAPIYSQSKSQEARSAGLGKQGREGIYALPHRILETEEVTKVLAEMSSIDQEILRQRRMQEEKESYRTLGERLDLTPTAVRRRERLTLERLVAALAKRGMEVPLGDTIRTSIGTTVVRSTRRG